MRVTCLIFYVCLMQPKKRGRRKGSKNKLSPEITRMLGDATLHYAYGHYEEVRCLMNFIFKHYFLSLTEIVSGFYDGFLQYTKIWSLQSNNSHMFQLICKLLDSFSFTIHFLALLTDFYHHNMMLGSVFVQLFCGHDYIVIFHLYCALYI